MPVTAEQARTELRKRAAVAELQKRQQPTVQSLVDEAAQQPFITHYPSVTDKLPPSRPAAPAQQFIGAAPEPTGWQRFKGFFTGDRPPLPPDADRLDKLNRAFNMAVGAPMRVFLKYTKGKTLNLPDLMWAGLKRITPDDMWDAEVKKMNLDQAMDWAAGYDPSGFEKTVGGLAEFVGRLQTAKQIGQATGILGRRETLPKDLTKLLRAGEAAKLWGLAATSREFSKLLAETIDPETDYQYEGATGILRDMGIGAGISLGSSVIVRPALSKAAQSAMGKKIIEAADRTMVNLSKRFPQTMDALRRNPQREFSRMANEQIRRTYKVDPAKFTPEQKAVSRHVAREFEKRFMRSYRNYMRRPSPDIVYRREPVQPPARIAAAPPEVPVKAPVRPVEAITPVKPIKPVPRNVLQEYKGEPWADKALAKPPVAKAVAEEKKLPEQVSHLDWVKGEKFYSARNLDEKFWDWFNSVGKTEARKQGIAVTKDWRGDWYAHTTRIAIKPAPAVEKVVKPPIVKPEMVTQAQKARAHIVAKSKGLIGTRGKPTQSYRRFAKAMTGKTSMLKMTGEEAEHFADMLGALTVSPRTGIAKIPTSKHIITKELADKIGQFKNIGALEKIRPAWRVFEKMGLYKEVFEPAFEAEISSSEELFAFREKANEMKRLVGTDKETSQRIFDAIEDGRVASLSANEQKVAKWIKRYYDDWADRFNLPPEKRRKNLITHIFERDITELLKEKHPLDPDLARALEFITPKTVFNPFLQKRLGKKVGLKRDIWSAIEAYESRALKKFYYEPLIKRIRVYEKFLPINSARYLRNFITRITSRPLVIDREINQTLKEVGAEIAKLPGGKRIAQYLTKGNASGLLAYNTAGIMYEAWLGLRPASAIKNLSQHGLILAETGPIAFSKALKITGKERSNLLAQSRVLRSRKLGYLPGIDQTFIKQLESKRRKITMAMFRAADRRNVSDAFLAGYYEAKTNGLPNEWAIKRGDEVAGKTQWLYSKFAGAELMQSSPGRVLGMLTTWPTNWAELMNDWIQAKPSRVYTDYSKATGKKTPKVNWAKRRKSLWTYLALVSLAALIHKNTRFKAMYYTGWTSISSLADIASGELPGLTPVRIFVNLSAGLATGDKRRIKQAWNEAKRFIVIRKELSDIISGKKDWLNLFIYLEREEERKKLAERRKAKR